MKYITFNKRNNFSSVEKIKVFINKYFSNYINNFDVKLLFENDIIKTWVFISDDDFYFIYDVKSNCNIHKIPRNNFSFKITDFEGNPNLSKIYISGVTYPTIISNDIIDIEKILNNYRLNLVD